jgi:hypothetical protein
MVHMYPGGQAPVLDPARQHSGALATGAGDRGTAGVGLEGLGVGLPGAIVPDLCEYAGAGQLCQAREAGDDGGVGVPFECALGGGL